MPYTVVDKSSLYFNTKLYTGNGGSSQSITGVGFQPDFVWIKDRPLGFDHNLFDSVRGIYKALFSNTAYVENFGQGSNTDSLTSFDADGFSVGGDDALNDPYTYVSWNWKANGTAVSNTVGTITSTVSANTTSGFSIVSYTGNGTNNATVGHGLGVTPAMLIVKNRDVADGWGVWNKGLGSATQQIQLNGTGAVFTDDVFNAVSSTTVTLGTDTWSNTSTKNYIMYCWSEVKGFSKFGKYTGNGSDDGTFVYTGFKPAFVLVKRTDSTGYWYLWDSARRTYNYNGLTLFPNASSAESSYTPSNPVVDFLSNGFKLRGSYPETNASGGTIIYIAFAENPFVSSKGLPCTAR